MKAVRSNSPAVPGGEQADEPTEAAKQAGVNQGKEKLDVNENETRLNDISTKDHPMTGEDLKIEDGESNQSLPSDGPVAVSKSEIAADESSNMSNDSDAASSTLVASGVITEAMLQEEKALHQKTIEDANEFQRQEEQSLKDLDDEIREQRYKRLQFLLSKSNMYTTYLIDRMKKQKQVDDEKASQKAKKKEKKEKPVMDTPAVEESPSPKKAVSVASAPGFPDLPPVRKTRGPPQVATRRSLRGQKDPISSQSTENSQGSQSSASSDESANKGKRGKKRKARESGDSYRISDYFAEAASRCKKQKLEDQPGETCENLVKQPVESSECETAQAMEDEEVRMIDGEAVDPLQPELLTGGVLRAYQIDGFKWLKVLFENGVNGILADEMGLGKTVQCISIVSHLVYHGVPGPFLVCAPLSTIPNWLAEFKRFAPKVPVVLYHGSIQEREVLRKKIWRNHPVREGVAVKPVVITSYEIAMNDRTKINMFEWRYIIVDEGHRIKNHKCRLIRELKMYKSTHRLLLTGTPLQNNLAELWSLLNFLLPEIFDDLGTFEAWFDIDALEAGSGGEQIVMQEQKNQVLSMLHQILTPFLLRRLKADVDLCIPPKRELLVYAPLTRIQQDYYKHTVERTIEGWIKKRNEKEEEKVKLDKKGRPLRRSTNKKVDYSLMLDEEKDYKDKAEEEEDIEAWVQAVVEKGESDRDTSGNGKKKTALLSVKMQNIMMQLRKCCNHPYLIEYPLDPKTGELITDPQIHHKSGKLLLLDRMLTELQKKGHKVLLFSQMTKMLDILEDYMYIKKYKYCRLDGSMKWEDRQEQMNQFNTDKDTFLFLLSTRAGGLGINLTAADTVIIYDSDWNPQSDLQAQDRCHRIGQTRPVMVYRLVSANTVDQKIVERAAAKRRLEKMVIHKGKFKSGIENFNTSLTAISPQELLELLQSRDHDGEVGTEQEVISRRDLQALLDRSDLYRQWEQAKLAATKGKPVGLDLSQESQCKDIEGVFKVIDEVSGKTGLETDLTAQAKSEEDMETVADVVCS